MDLERQLLKTYVVDAPSNLPALYDTISSNTLPELGAFFDLG